MHVTNRQCGSRTTQGMTHRSGACNRDSGFGTRDSGTRECGALRLSPARDALGIPQTRRDILPESRVPIPESRIRNQQETLTLRDRYLVDLGAEIAGGVRQDPARLLPYSVRRFLRCIVSLTCFESINAPPRRKRT